jgi:hypothetical protein
MLNVMIAKLFRRKKIGDKIGDLVANQGCLAYKISYHSLLRKRHIFAKNWRKSPKKVIITLAPGVDVMITIFCYFRQFSAKQLAFYSKTNVMIKFCSIKLCFESKTPIFANSLAKIFF